MSVVTTSSQEAKELLGNAIVQLREWGTERAHRLPAQALRCRLGTEDDCAVRLSDPQVLPVHAQLTRERQQWLTRALGDTPGLLRDGAHCHAFALEPGVELGVGSTTLVAESEHWIALRSFCARMLGWDRDRLAVVDRALRSIRMSMMRFAPLVLRGDSDLVALARSLHRRMLGVELPFVVCDPRRRGVPGSVRSAANCQTGAAGMQAAAGGSLCVCAKRLPKDFGAVLARIREPDARVQLIVCANSREDVGLLAAPIEVPPLSARAADLPRIVDEFALDAIAALGASPTSFHSADRDWVLANVEKSLPAIEKATLRLVALRTSANLSRAAARLGMAPVSLSRWLGRRARAPRA
jgi:hypothetical protein